MKKSEFISQVITTNWSKYKSTSKLSEEFDIPLRTIQHYILKMYRDEGIVLDGYIYRDRPSASVESEALEVTQTSKEVEDFNKTSSGNVQLGRQLFDEIKNGTVVVFSDAHIIPNIRSSAQKALLSVCKSINPDMIINLGDIFDFASISSHDKLSWENRFTLEEELQAGLDFMEDVHKSAPQAKKYFLFSNHDCRYNKFLAKHAPQFKGVKGFSLEDHIPSYWNNCMSLTLNKNTIFLHQYHGGVHAGYNNVVKSGISIVTGHTHLLENKPFTDYNGTRYGIQTGTLSSIKDNPLFNYTLGTPLNWIAGFTILTYMDGELQMPEFCTVNKDNQAVFRGKVVC